MLINHLISAALLNKLVHPRYAYIAPTYKQAKSIAWDYLKMFAGPYLQQGSTKLSLDVIYQMAQELLCYLLNSQTLLED